VSLTLLLLPNIRHLWIESRARYPTGLIQSRTSVAETAERNRSPFWKSLDNKEDRNVRPDVPDAQ